ncbi:CocE/NonD family hydrolase [Acidovorax sp. SUPP2825]|uniref:dienelactone hydrolase family protein n=1 Tax=Acidovorax sp. SUPP2825 TaxID=2920879 RepID=UPI0023DE2A5E|nr:CocE/NonD family hydrolase [Acidovorax sp. SUPP2825]GKS94977.1 alpha/beta hydrolase [Acidovorax sp. SUPP2825]
MTFRRHTLAWLLHAALLMGALPALAKLPSPPPPELDATLREQVVMVRKGEGPKAIELETTVYRPPGAGPFPVVVINHGKSKGDTHLTARQRYLAAARVFVERGYLVVIPMRQGFAQSTGAYPGTGCDVERNGRKQAEDVQAALAYVRRLPDADSQRIVVVGQSHGGLTTMALGALNPPGVRGLINFAGGLRQDTCPGWQEHLVSAFGAYGEGTKLPSLWFYGDNDSYWSPSLYRDMFARYSASGGPAKLVAYGKFGTDSHRLFSSQSGVPIWLPEVDRFLAGLGLPSRPVTHIPMMPHDSAVPRATDAYPVADASAIPYVRDAAREGYRKFLAAPWPRAYAIAPSGAWAYYYGRADAMAAAVARCNENAKAATCHLYAVDDHVVWEAP